MDGVIFDSMPSHAIAWSQTLKAHGFPFEERDAYLNEGRTGEAVIRELAEQAGRDISDSEIRDIYEEKAALFRRIDAHQLVPGIEDVLHFVKESGAQIWLVTGSGQRSLLDKLESVFPGIFCRERMITAYDVQRGKPDPEPYLMAWQGSGLSKEECCVVENAPLGVRAGKAAGLYTFAVNTGKLLPSDLSSEGADLVLPSMAELLHTLLTLH